MMDICMAIEDCIKKLPDILCYEELLERNLFAVTVEATAMGYINSETTLVPHVTAHAVKWLAQNHPELLDEPWDTTAGTDYLGVLTNVVVCCENIFDQHTAEMRNAYHKGVE